MYNDSRQDDLRESRVLAVYDQLHQPHLVMILRLGDEVLDIEPSPEARAQLDQDLAVTHEEARHLPVIGWLIEKALFFAERGMTGYFGPHDLATVQMQFDGQTLHLRVRHTDLVLGPGESIRGLPLRSSRSLTPSSSASRHVAGFRPSAGMLGRPPIHGHPYRVPRRHPELR
jgi:hypothetical protein